MCKVTKVKWREGQNRVREVWSKVKIISIWSSQKIWVTVGCKLLLSWLQIRLEVIILIWVIWMIVVMDIGIILGIVIIVVVRVLVADKGWGHTNSSACTQTNSSTALRLRQNHILISLISSLHKDIYVALYLWNAFTYTYKNSFKAHNTSSKINCYYAWFSDEMHDGTRAAQQPMTNKRYSWDLKPTVLTSNPTDSTVGM